MNLRQVSRELARESEGPPQMAEAKCVVRIKKDSGRHAYHPFTNLYNPRGPIARRMTI